MVPPPVARLAALKLAMGGIFSVVGDGVVVRDGVIVGDGVVVEAILTGKVPRSFAAAVLRLISFTCLACREML